MAVILSIWVVCHPREEKGGPGEGVGGSEVGRPVVEMMAIRGLFINFVILILRLLLTAKVLLVDPKVAFGRASSVSPLALPPPCPLYPICRPRRRFGHHRYYPSLPFVPLFLPFASLLFR